MKNIVVLVLGLIISSATSAKDDKDTLNRFPLTAKVSLVDEGRIELTISQIDKVAFIKFKDENGYVIYDNKVYLKKGIVQPFDVSQLKAGKYTLTIEVGGKKLEELIIVQSANTERSVHVL